VSQVGPVAVVREQRGGMSAGCATSLQTGNGRLLFLKAVGAEQNPQTLELFRYETRVLRSLPAVPYGRHSPPGQGVRPSRGPKTARASASL
jgi:hypothetical protein